VDVALCLAHRCLGQRGLRRVRADGRRHAAAFRDPAVVSAATSGPRRAAAVAVLTWSGVGAQDVVLGWTRLDGRGERGPHRGCDRERARASRRPGATAIGEGMAAGLALLGAFQGEARRHVLDVSGDGRHSAGRAPGPVRGPGRGGGDHGERARHPQRGAGPARHYVAEVIGGPGQLPPGAARITRTSPMRSCASWSANWAGALIA
jgi:hypothetical protein